MSTLKVDTIKSDTTPTVNITDGLSVTGVTTSTGKINCLDVIDIDANNKALRIGSAQNLQLTYTGSAAEISNIDASTPINIKVRDGAETAAVFNANSSVDLYHNNVKTFETEGNGIIVKGPEGGDAHLYVYADEGDDDADKWRLQAYPSTSKFLLQNYASGSWKTSIQALGGTAGVTLSYDNDSKLETTSSGIKVPIAVSGHGITVDAASNNVYPQLTFNANRSAKNNSIGYIRGQWNSTDVVAIDFVAGPDTTNKDDGHIKFQTRPSGGGVTERLRITSLGLVRVPDTGKFVCGDADDLQIHHTSSVNHIRSANGNVVIGTDANNMVILGAYYNAGGGGDTCEVWGGSNFLPATNDAIDLGETNHKWDDIYATNGTIQTSDQNNKDNIATSDLGLSFIDKLSPKSYKFKGKTRTHYGLIAQDVETVLSDISKATSDFAGFIKTDAPVQLYNERDEAQNRIPSGKAIGDVKLAAHTDYGLRYGEFIGPLIKAVQELSAKVTALESA